MELLFYQANLTSNSPQTSFPADLRRTSQGVGLTISPQFMSFGAYYRSLHLSIGVTRPYLPIPENIVTKILAITEANLPRFITIQLLLMKNRPYSPAETYPVLQGGVTFALLKEMRF